MATRIKSSEAQQSFGEVMLAFTSDHHFEQAGFTILLQ